MINSVKIKILLPLAAALIVAVMSSASAAAAFPPPPAETSVASKELRVAYFSGGCFWGVEAVFESLKGVKDVVSGYIGGSAANAHYDIVSEGASGHAESVMVSYYPAQISYGTLLKVFFSVAHDPTQLNYQGPDHGTQYRSVIWFGNTSEESIAKAYIKKLDDAKIFPARIVTAVQKFPAFYAAEDYHQNFLKNNPTYPYIVYWDLPKLEKLRQTWPDLVASK